jgi:branched-chain amino acid transport system ATP-binding protein
VIATESILSVRGIVLRFGGVVALNDVSFDVAAGEIFAVIGPNGAGKTSIFNCLNGIYHPQEGSLTFDGTDISRRAPSAIARLGIARTFQNLALFSGATVLENVMLGRHNVMHTSFVSGMLWAGQAAREERSNRAVCAEILDRLDLGSYRDEPIRTLPYGIQKRVEFARALAMEPKLILLDEPVAGMNSDESAEMAQLIASVRAQAGIPMILVEHDMPTVMSIADRISVLDFGRVIATGTPQEIQRNPAAIAAYMGTAE